MFAAPDFSSDQSQKFMSHLQADTAGFRQLADMLKQLAGIDLPSNPKNMCLMASRLLPILRTRGCKGYADYHRALSGDKNAVREFISAMTTNTTEFFREAKHYDVLKNLIDEVAAEKRGSFQPEIRLWCAAASSGQEPYSLLMTLLEKLPEGSAGWKLKILATDIDRDVLAKAAKGIYSEHEAQTAGRYYLQKYFIPVLGKKEGEKKYMVKPDVRDIIRFAFFNLMTEPYPFQHPFDFVFCRNVLIYFDKATAGRVIEKLALSLRPGGYLFLGHSETGLTKTPLLKTVAHAVYQRK